MDKVEEKINELKEEYGEDDKWFLILKKL
jgi:hypothetical protein